MVYNLIIFTNNNTMNNIKKNIETRIAWHQMQSKLKAAYKVYEATCNTKCRTLLEETC